ncbi:MAG: universal stress protein [Euryarchaeota archaeon]|nr:universal stress protein [Euryarchaeota archaeon]
MFTKILVQLDPSRPLLKAPRAARAIAEKTDAALYALYIVDEKITGILGADLIVAMDTALESVAEEALEQYAQSVAERVNTTKAIGYGDTSETIAKYVIRHQVDLVVTGGFHAAVYQRIPFGSIVNEIIRKTPASVLLYRDTHHDPLRSGPIVFAYDGSPGSRRALHQAAAFAEMWGGRLEVVHVYNRGRRNQADALLSEVAATADRLKVPVTTTALPRPVIGSRARPILKHAKAVDATTVSLSSKGSRTTFAGLSPIVEHLVIHTDRPLLVIHS